MPSIHEKLLERRRTKQRVRRIPFLDDSGWRQMMPPKPDDVSGQDPDWIFLGELAQVSEEQLHEPIKRVLYRVGGPVRNTQDIHLDQYTFLRPKQTQFVLVELQDGQRSFGRYNTTIHGAWEDIEDSGFTPSEFIQDIYLHGEKFPAIIKQFLNERKKEVELQKPIGIQNIIQHQKENKNRRRKRQAINE